MTDSNKSVWWYWPVFGGAAAIVFGIWLGCSLPTRAELARDAVRAELEARNPPAAAPAQVSAVARLADGTIDHTQITAFSIRTPNGRERGCVLAARVGGLALWCEPYSTK